MVKATSDEEKTDFQKQVGNNWGKIHYSDILQLYHIVSQRRKAEYFYGILSLFHISSEMLAVPSSVQMWTM